MVLDYGIVGARRDIPPETERHTVAEAAAKLGITTGAVRNRLSRGTLQSVKQGGTVYVLLPADTPRDTERDTADIPGGIPHPERDPLTSELRDRLRYVERQLEAERAAHAEARRLLLSALEKIPPAIEPPAGEPPGAPTEATEHPGRIEPQPSVRGAQRAQESPEMHMPEVGGGPQSHDQQRAPERPWWRRWFGA